MGIENLEKIFSPKAVAVIGAGERKGSIGGAVFRNLLESGYGGVVYPVNPRHASVFGRSAYARMADIPGDVDLAVFAVPIHLVPGMVAEAAEFGVGGAVVVSAGGKETGDAGRRIESDIFKAAAAGGIRVIGPNCIGVMAGRSRLNATFAPSRPMPGHIAFITQSGAIGSAILDLAVKEHIGFSHFISLGSMLDVDFGDLIDYLGNEPDVASIVVYMETISRVRYFMSAARAVCRIKPVVVLKAGRSQAGAAAASSHTGAMAGVDDVYEAAFERAGVVRVKTFEELFDCAELLSRRPVVTGPDLAIVTNTGGPGVMALDSLADYGLEPACLRKETIAELSPLLPPHWNLANPIDMIGDADAVAYAKTAEICLQADEIDSLLIILAPSATVDPAHVAETLVNVIKTTRKPVFTCWLGGPAIEAGRDIFNRNGIPTFDSPERAVRAFADLIQHKKRSEMLQQIPPRATARFGTVRKAAIELVHARITDAPVILTEPESKKILQAYGIPVNPTEIACTKDDAVVRAEQMGYPVAMKILAPGVAHKTEIGGVRLNLRTDADIIQAFEEMKTRMAADERIGGRFGVTIQSMVASAGPELILGARQDPDFGPVLLFGMGGTTTEVLKDRALGLPPLNRLLARRMIESTRVFRLLSGYRGSAPANLGVLEEILIRLSMVVSDFAEIAELDINPLLICEDGFCAVDARIALNPAKCEAPNHLVISPYPVHLEARITMPPGTDVMIRPIRPEDAGMMEDLFDSLSPRSIYLRFFSPLKKLPHSLLARFTQIDYDREIAMVALDETSTPEKMLGVARIMPTREMKTAEFAVLVGDAWQGKGIGAELLLRCLKQAHALGFEVVFGAVLTENTQMLKLGRKLGFETRRVPQAAEYEMRIDLSSTFQGSKVDLSAGRLLQPLPSIS